MIVTFKSQTAQDIFDGVISKRARKIPVELHTKIQRLFDQLNAATKIETLKSPPGNRLEKLQGDLAGYWSLRINQQWRVIFQWEAGKAKHVDIVDYH